MSDFKNTLNAANGGEQKRFGRLSAKRREAITDAVVSKLIPAIVPRAMDSQNKKEKTAPNPSLVQSTTTALASSINDAKNMMTVLPDLQMVQQLLVSTILSPHDLMKVELNFRLINDDLREYGPPMLAVIEKYFTEDYKIVSGLEKALEKMLFKTGSHVIAVIPETSIDEIINGEAKTANEALLGEYFDGGKPRPYGILGPGNYQDASVLANSRGQKTAMESLLGMESLVPSFGFSADQETLSYLCGNETYNITITDNPNVLKTPLLKDKITKDRLAGIYEARSIRRRSDSNGDTKNTAGDSSYKKLFTPKQYGFKAVASVKTQDELTRPTVGHPMLLELPSESVIPVHVPGSPDQHLAYYVVLDTSGNPLNLAAIREFYDTMTAGAVSTNLRESLLRDSSRIQEGRTARNDITVDELNRLCSEVIEDDLARRLKNGIYGTNASLAKPTIVYQMMFARMMAGQHTQLLFLPAELVTYMAFDFNEFGQGVSLMEQNKTTGTIRALLTVANTMATINNSVNHVRVNLKLDPNDPNPADTVEKTYHEVARTRQFRFPQAVNGMNDLADFMQQAAIGMAISGNEAYPETEIDIENVSNNRIEISTELDESMKKRHYLGFGVTPEMVDQSMTADFATSIIQQNLLTAKRSMLYGKKFADYYTEHIRKYTLNDQALMDALREIVKNISMKDYQSVVDEAAGKITTQASVNKEDTVKVASDEVIDKLVMHFIDSVEVSLPEPDMTQFDIQKEAFETYSSSLDGFISSVLNSDMYTNETIGELSSSIDQVKAVLKAELERDWLIRNNVVPELFKMINVDGADGDKMDMLKRHQRHMDTLAKSMLGFAKTAFKRKNIYDAIFGALGGEEVDDNNSQPDDGQPDDGFDDGMDGQDELLDDGLSNEAVDEDPGTTEDDKVDAGKDEKVDTDIDIEEPEVPKDEDLE